MFKTDKIEIIEKNLKNIDNLPSIHDGFTETERFIISELFRGRPVEIDKMKKDIIDKHLTDEKIIDKDLSHLFFGLSSVELMDSIGVLTLEDEDNFDTRHSSVNLTKWYSDLKSTKSQNIYIGTKNKKDSIEKYYTLPYPLILSRTHQGFYEDKKFNNVSFNLLEVLEELKKLIESKGDREVLKPLVPDFKEGGKIEIEEKELKKLMEKGKAKYISKAKIEKVEGSKNTLLVDEIPHIFDKKKLIETIESIKSIETIEDGSIDYNDLYLKIILKKDEDIDEVIKELYEKTELEKEIEVETAYLDVDDNIVFKGIYDILVEWYEKRKVEIYNDLEISIENLESKVEVYKDIIKFVTEDEELKEKFVNTLVFKDEGEALELISKEYNNDVLVEILKMKTIELREDNEKLEDRLVKAMGNLEKDKEKLENIDDTLDKDVSIIKRRFNTFKRRTEFEILNKEEKDNEEKEDKIKKPQIKKDNKSKETKEKDEKKENLDDVLEIKDLDDEDDDLLIIEDKSEEDMIIDLSDDEEDIFDILDDEKDKDKNKMLDDFLNS